MYSTNVGYPVKQDLCKAQTHLGFHNTHEPKIQSIQSFAVYLLCG